MKPMEVGHIMQLNVDRSEGFTPEVPAPGEVTPRTPEIDEISPSVPELDELAPDVDFLEDVSEEAIDQALQVLEQARLGDVAPLDGLLGLSGAAASGDDERLLRQRFCEFLQLQVDDAADERDEAAAGMATLLEPTVAAWDGGAAFTAALAQEPRRFLGLAILHAESSRTLAQLVPLLEHLWVLVVREGGIERALPLGPTPDPTVAARWLGFWLLYSPSISWLDIAEGCYQA